MAQCIGAVAVDGEPHSLDLPLCVCGMPAEEGGPRCADCLVEAERDAEEQASDDEWARCAA
jgi:hypothetical protein